MIYRCQQYLGFIIPKKQLYKHKDIIKCSTWNKDMNINKDELIQKLAAFGFEYSEENNKFW